MNEINVEVSFKNNYAEINGYKIRPLVVSGDYNSTKMIFNFDTIDGTKVLEIKNPLTDEIVYKDTIRNNESVLVGYADVLDENNYIKYTDNEENIYWYDKGNNVVYDSEYQESQVEIETLTKVKGDVATIFANEGDYICEISLYGNDSKLSVLSFILPVGPEAIKDNDKEAIIYKPVFDSLINTVNEKIEEMESVKEDVIHANEEAERIISEFEEDVDTYTTAFNQNAEEKINAVNQIYENTQELVNGFDSKVEAAEDDLNTIVSNAETIYNNFNTNAAAKLNEYNTNASNKLNEYNTNASSKISAYNTNATEKVEAYNTNATSKLNAYNDNATSKTTAFDTNATNKTNTFDSNADEKTTEYNENAAAKVEEFNQTVDSIQESIDNHEERISDLERNQKKGEATGTEIDLTDAFDTRPRYLGIDATETTQGENPSPDNPQDVETMVGYNNKFTTDYTELAPIRILDKEKNNFKLLSSWARDFVLNNNLLLMLKPNTTYTISCQFKILSRPSSFGSSNHNKILSLYKSPELIDIVATDLKNTAPLNTWINYTNTITTPNDLTDWKILYYDYKDSSNNTTGEIDINKFQITEGTEEKPYVPYGTNYMVLDDVGKNLFDKDNVVYIDRKILNSNGVEVNDSTGGYTKMYIPVKSSTDYTISGLSSTGSKSIYFFDENKNYISQLSYFSGTNKSFVTPNNCKYIDVMYYINGNNFNDYLITEGTSVIPYEPYQHKQYPISLANQELLNKDDHVDKIIVDESTGQSYIDKVWGKVVLDGSESGWSLVTSGEVPYYRYRYVTGIRGAISFCNLFAPASISTSGDSLGYSLFPGNGEFRAREQQMKTLADWKTYLATNNLILFYPLAEPQLIPIDNPNIKLLNGVNHITNSEGAEMDIIYVKDINMYLENELSIIKNAIVSLGGDI